VLTTGHRRWLACSEAESTTRFANLQGVVTTLGERVRGMGYSDVRTSIAGSAPTLHTTAFGGSGQIVGDFTQARAKALAVSLQHRLPISLAPSTSLSSKPDRIQRGVPRRSVSSTDRHPVPIWVTQV
jgi:hypothetical protein